MRLKHECRRESVVKKSRFIACANRCTSEQEARDYIASLQKEFRDASHICTAYIYGPADEFQKSNDNHEPSGTAGIPILKAIQQSGLSDTIVCVVRYFGGIKLGAGGLIRAYGGAASDVLKDAPKTTEVETSRWQIIYPYSYAGTLEKWLRTYTTIEDMQYDEQISCIFLSSDENLEEKIADLTRGECKAEYLGSFVQEADL